MHISDDVYTLLLLQCYLQRKDTFFSQNVFCKISKRHLYRLQKRENINSCKFYLIKNARQYRIYVSIHSDLKS